MNSGIYLCVALMGLGGLAACATTAELASSEAKAPPEYRTGSNIPVKDKTPPPTAAQREQTVDQVRVLQQTRVNGKPGG